MFRKEGLIEKVDLTFYQVKMSQVDFEMLQMQKLMEAYNNPAFQIQEESLESEEDYIDPKYPGILTHFGGGYINNKGNFKFFKSPQEVLETAQDRSNIQTTEELENMAFSKLSDGSWEQLPNRDIVNNAWKTYEIESRSFQALYGNSFFGKKLNITPCKVEDNIPEAEKKMAWIKDKKNHKSILSGVSLTSFLSYKYPLKVSVV